MEKSQPAKSGDYNKLPKKSIEFFCFLFFFFFPPLFPCMLFIIVVIVTDF